MTDTYIDRLFGAVLDEVRDPSMPPFGEEPAEFEPSSESGSEPRSVSRLGSVSDPGSGGVAVLTPRRSRMKSVAGIAAAVLLLAGGGALIVKQETPTQVKTIELGGAAANMADGAGEAPIAQTPYFTFADPVGTVYRNARTPANSGALVFSSTSEPGQSFLLERGLTESDFKQFDEVGVFGGRQLRSLPANQSGVRLSPVVTWREADGSIWTMLTSLKGPVNFSEVLDAAQERAIRVAIEGFLENLNYSDGSFSAGTGYEAESQLPWAERRWSISDDRRELSLISGVSPLALSTLKGEPAKVAGHDAVVVEHQIYWEVEPGEILRLTIRSPDPNHEGGESPTSVTEKISEAESLVASSRAEYESLRLLRGQAEERVVVELPAGTDSATVLAESAAEGMGGLWTSPIGPDGLSLYTTNGFDTINGFDSVAVTEGFWIWANSSPLKTTIELFSDPGVPIEERFPQRPSCAQWVAVPPAGEPAVTVVLDPTCTG